MRIPDEEKDPDLKEKLLKERPGILAWAVRGCLAWQRNGLGTPDEVSTATATYRSESDIVQAFLDSECVTAPGTSVSKSELYQAYKEWTEKSGEHHRSQRDLSQRLQEKGFNGDRNHNGHFWCGVGLRAEMEA